MTKDGHLNADARRKLKQVNHLVGLLTPALQDVFDRYPSPTLVDCGSGNAYLGMVLYELFLKPLGRGVLHAVESRAELVTRAQARAARMGFERLEVHESAIAGAPVPDRVHLLLALHACDTATDDALALGVARRADHVAVVPCCQAELAAQLKEGRERVHPALRPLFEHPLHRRELGSHLANVIRALALEAHGYQVTVTELTGFEHSLKNELILGRRVHRESRDAQARLERLLEDTGLRPHLLERLRTGTRVSSGPG